MVRPTVFSGAEQLILEIQFGVGGEDSKLFVDDLGDMYRRYGQIKGFRTEVLLDEIGHWVIKFSGKGVWEAFQHEPGKHCVQRVPPTERDGRRQTSMISVAVLPLPPVNHKDELPESELDVKFQTGRQKAGGQNVNKVASACRMKHIPTGLSVFINGRDQKANRKEALHILTARVNEHRQKSKQASYNSQRKDQLGDGGRGDKVRTYNFIKGFITDHRLDRETRSIKQVMKGDLSPLLG